LSISRVNRNPRAAGASGFTLIEVLVALTIAALGLGSLMAAAGLGLGNVQAADHFVEATRRAQSRLAMAGVTPKMVVGDSSGDDGGGYVWHLTIQPIATRQPLPKSDAAPLGLYNIAVTIGWREKHQVKSVSVQSQRVWPVAGGHG
jgi:prepilin-type N-terminal cleavage/methylation domain-containing protein